MNDEEKRIKFPDEHYVGFQSRKADVNLGFMTPYGTDKAAQKRIQTVDNWAKRNNRTYDHERKVYVEKDHIPPVVLKNAPVQGFKVSNFINRSASWAKCRDKWRVEDPRGFELEITSGNLEKIMENSDIIKGTIQESCIWARLGAENILIPTNMELYKSVKSNTNRYNSKASTRDLKPGYKAILQNGQEGIYMGLFHVVTLQRGYNTERANSVILGLVPNKKHVFRTEGTNTFFCYASPKLSSIEKAEVLTNTEQLVNKCLNDKGTIVSHSDSLIIGVTSVKYMNFKLKLYHDKDANYAIKNNHTIGYHNYSDDLYASFRIRNKNSHLSDESLVRAYLVRKMLGLPYVPSQNKIGGIGYYNSYIHTSAVNIPGYPSTFDVAAYEYETSYGYETYNI